MNELIAFFHTCPPEAVLLIQGGLVYGFLLLTWRFFGTPGLMAFIPLCIVGANLQVLKLVQFSFHFAPMTLGNVLFAGVFLATDILNEHKGPETARRAVFLGFWGYLFTVLILLAALAFRPLTPAEAGDGPSWVLSIHPHMKALFMPAPALFAASMISYFTSQFLDIRVFSAIRRKTGTRFLWLRNNASTFLSSLVDNALFNTLAFVVFASVPVSGETLFQTYILGMMLMRWGLALLDTPVIYLSRRLSPIRERHG